MPEFNKGNDWSNKFLSKSPWKKETRWEGPKTKDSKSKMKDSGKLYSKMKDSGKLYSKMKDSGELMKQMKSGKLYSKGFKSSHLKATIAKDPSIDEELGLNKMKTTETTKKKDWEPAFEGADHSQEELDKMTKEEKEAYYD